MTVLFPSRADVVAGRIDHHLHAAGAPDADCCYLGHVGRRSGRRYETEIWFGAWRDTVYIVSGNGPGADWYRNALAAGSLDLRIGAHTWSGRPVRTVDSPTERELTGWLMAHRYPTWQGDPAIALTRDMWCFTCPILAIELADPAGAFERAARRVANDEAVPGDEAIQLVGMMTISERLGCLDGDLPIWPWLFDISSGGYHRHPFPAAVVERLGVPGLHFSDGPRGCVIGDRTAFPVSMARGATFDPELEQQVGVAIGNELRSAGANFYGGVCVNLLRHPGWGRAQETYGEDPYHVAAMGTALVTGAQTRVMACVKHFALNSMENARFNVDVTADERTLHEVYLPHFRRIIDAGVAAVMSAYNSVNGEWCGQSRKLLTEILRDEWGFAGAVISDFIFGLRDPVESVRHGLDIEMPFGQQRAAQLPVALAEGRLTMAEIVAPAERVLGMLLRFDPASGSPAGANHGLSSRQGRIAEVGYDAAAHRALARTAAERSIVLLRNEAGTLPLPESLGTVAVLGRLAAIPNLGDHGSSRVMATDVVTPLDGLRAALGPERVVHHDHDATIAEGADAVVVVIGCTYRDEGEFIGDSTREVAAATIPAMTAADRQRVADWSANQPAAQAAAEIANEPDSAGFATGGDRRSIRLSVDDEALVAAAAAVCRRVVVVLMGGSAIAVEPWQRDAAAVLMLWYPGVEGGHALADVVLGRVNPSGRLPFAVPTDESHLAAWNPDANTAVYDLWHGQWKLDRDGNPAAYPFGYGLSYSDFAIDAATIHPDAGTKAAVGSHLVQATPDSTLPPPPAAAAPLAPITTAIVHATVRNIGGRAGSTVVFAFAGLPTSTVARPARRLVGFARVDVAVGNAVEVDVPIDLGEIAVRRDGGWWMEPGEYDIEVGQHATDASAIVLRWRVD